jgi:ribosomal protein S18 acetylase RimI-like enzyme
MFLKLAELLKSQGAVQYLLEVLQQNTSAFELYKKQGFEITRSLACFRMEKSSCRQKRPYCVEHVDCFKPEEWEQVKIFWDSKPSWQNSIDSICAIPDAFLYSVVRIDNKIIGYGIIQKNSGDIPQLAVDRAYRRKGIASSILSYLADNSLSDKLAILNVDDSDTAMKEFLTASGFENYVNQYEMILDMHI